MNEENFKKELNKLVAFYFEEYPLDKYELNKCPLDSQLYYEACQRYRFSKEFNKESDINNACLTFEALKIVTKRLLNYKEIEK